MNAITFIGYYNKYVAELEAVMKVECKKAIRSMKQKDPHDLISPDTWFPSEYCARGFVYSLFLNECRKNNNHINNGKQVKKARKENYAH